MRPCTGVNGICPPLCSWSQLQDGTYDLADVERFNQAITQMVDERVAAINSANASRQKGR